MKCLFCGCTESTPCVSPYTGEPCGWVVDFAKMNELPVCTECVPALVDNLLAALHTPDAGRLTSAQFLVEQTRAKFTDTKSGLALRRYR